MPYAVSTLLGPPALLSRLAETNYRRVNDLPLRRVYRPGPRLDCNALSSDTAQVMGAMAATIA